MGDRLIVRVEFSADGVGRFGWNCDVQDPRTGLPMSHLPADAVERAIFERDEMGDMRLWDNLRRYSAARAEMIERHFMVCARKMIAEIECQEKWPHAIKDQEPSDG